MNEKGFVTGVATKTKHLFSRIACEREAKAPLQDGNRAWVTLMACVYVCGGGSALPPGLLYESANSTIQSSWVVDINPETHSVLVSSSPSRWTNNEVGLARLKQVFGRFSEHRARRKYCLLIFIGYGSHITMEFVNYYDWNNIS
jgi:hypothetical protein